MVFGLVVVGVISVLLLGLVAMVGMDLTDALKVRRMRRRDAAAVSARQASNRARMLEEQAGLQPWTSLEREAFGINDTDRFIQATDLALGNVRPPQRRPEPERRPRVMSREERAFAQAQQRAALMWKAQQYAKNESREKVCSRCRKSYTYYEAHQHTFHKGLPSSS